MQYMKAKLLVRNKEVRDDGSIIEIVIWSLQQPVPPCTHLFKYQLFYGRKGNRIVCYDNERGKGDHRHFKGMEAAYKFLSIEQLLVDFEKDLLLIERGES